MAGGCIRLTASGVVKARAGRITGFYVASTTTGTITLYDNTSATGTQISGVITPAVGWHKFPSRFSQGLFADIANTLDVTFFVEI
jgi:hypothetical protein